jgi:hypothetical protein
MSSLVETPAKSTGKLTTFLELEKIISDDSRRNQTALSGLESLEAPGVEPVFLEKRQAINYAENRASFRSGEIRVFNSSGGLERKIRFTEADRKL